MTTEPEPMTYRERQVYVESWFMPDTTLHELNGGYVVQLTLMDNARRKGYLCITPDEAERLAEQIKAAATAAREWKDWQNDAATDDH